MPKKASLKEFKKLARNNLSLSTNNKLNYIVDIFEKANRGKDTVLKDTGLVFNDKFSDHECLWDQNYPENPERYRSVMRRIVEYDLLDRCKIIECREACLEEILTKHNREQVDLLKSTANNMSVEELELLASKYDSVYFNKATYSTALLAAGSSIELVKAVVNGTIQNGMAILRPPGHHAMKNEYCGYCFFNNVALAAQHALDNFSVNKILIVDWDVHHGQATQQMFYNDSRVMYFSIHRYEHGSFWPCLRESNFDYVGEGEGFGYNINIPLNETGCSDADYLSIFHTVLLPLAYEYNPDVVLVSAGYDAAIGCPEGRMGVTPACYAQLTGMLMSLAQGKVAVFLEGGYFCPSLSESAALTLAALLGDNAPQLLPLSTPKPTVTSSMLNVIYILRHKWKCFSHYFHKDNRRVHQPEIIYNGGELLPPFPTRDSYFVNSQEEFEMYSQLVNKLHIDITAYKLHMLNKVGFCYDADMLLHKSPTGNTYERPERLETTMCLLTEYGLLERMSQLKCRQATSEELHSVHSSSYLNKIKEIKSSGESELLSKERWHSVYFNDHSTKCAELAAGSIVQLVDDVLSGKCSSAVGIVRPPGHHADIDQPGGFCIVNNVAIAAKHAIQNKNIERVMILDWDVHHGNGTQKIFLNDPKVLYLSLHRYDHAKFYPNLTSANFTEKGEGDAAGYNINIAWNDGKMGDSEYMAAFLRIVLPIAYEFCPQLLLVSAGFDAAVGDPLGGYTVSPEAFGHFVKLLKPACSGKLVIILEGGYNINSVGYCMAMCCKALLGDPLPSLDSICQPNICALTAISNTIDTHSFKWKQLIPDVVFLPMANT